MRTVPFQQVLHATARLLGLNPSRDLNTERAASLTVYLNTAVTPAWKFDWWPEAMEVEQRRFHADYTAGEFIAAGDFRYHIGSAAYYVALQLQAAASQAPATLSASVWTENSAYWALALTSYTAADQISGETLAAGDQRRDPHSGKFYQIHTAHTTSSEVVDLTKAGELTPLRRAIAFDQDGQTRIGTVKQVCERDPRVFPRRPGKLNHTVGNGGVIVTAARVPHTVWVEFRRRAPEFTSTPYATPATGEGYDLDDLVYYQGGVFRSLIGNNEAALDNTEQWEYVGFPEILADHCQLAAAGMALGDQKQNDRKNDLLRQAQAKLEEVREQEITSQQEPEAAEVMTYGR